MPVRVSPYLEMPLRTLQQVEEARRRRSASPIATTPPLPGAKPAKDNEASRPDTKRAAPAPKGEV